MSKQYLLSWETENEATSFLKWDMATRGLRKLAQMERNWKATEGAQKQEWRGHLVIAESTAGFSFWLSGWWHIGAFPLTQKISRSYAGSPLSACIKTVLGLFFFGGSIKMQMKLLAPLSVWLENRARHWESTSERNWDAYLFICLSGLR